MNESENQCSVHGKFIVLEGIDGSGTTTQGLDLTNYLRGRGRRTIYTREPSTGPVGMIIRLALTGRLKGYIPNGANQDTNYQDVEMSTELNPSTMALLFAADRVDHIEAEIKPNLTKGRTVISDRYLMSSIAYQGLTMDATWLVKINEKVIRPDLTIYLDTPAERARMRIQGTRWSEDICEGITEQKRVREKYHEIIEDPPSILGPIVRVDALKSREEVQYRIRRIVDTFLESGQWEELQGELGLFGRIEAGRVDVRDHHEGG